MLLLPLAGSPINKYNVEVDFTKQSVGFTMIGSFYSRIVSITNQASVNLESRKQQKKAERDTQCIQPVISFREFHNNMHKDGKTTRLE